MAVRKSKAIGTVINGYEVLDSRHYKKDTQYLLKCEKCGNEFWKSRGFIKAKSICPYCSNGRNYHNANGYEHEELHKRYMEIIRRINHHEHYKNIKMCDEWLNDYQAFRKWALENGYREGLTIDRIDNSKGYGPSNCRWANAKEQANNKTTNRVITYKGETGTVTMLAEKYNVDNRLIYQRLKRGWTVEQAFEKPVDKTKYLKKRRCQHGREKENCL